ncbi:MAG TPA: hypothetical protein VNS08_03565 [Ureibacillus sp.]|nr:hypothetical protein [Ureibacillus sp.]
MQNRNPNRNQMMNNSSSNSKSEEEFIAKLSALGSVIQTIGGVMSTAASLLALQKFQQDILLEEEEENLSSDSDNRIGALENQIQYLMKEIEELKRGKR